MMENCVKRAVDHGKRLLLVCAASAALGGCLLNSVPVPVVYGDGASYSPYSMPKLKNGERVITVAPGGYSFRTRRALSHGLRRVHSP